MVRFLHNCSHVRKFSAGTRRRRGVTEEAWGQICYFLSGVAGPFFPGMVELSITFDSLVPVIISDSVQRLDLTLELGSRFNDESMRFMVNFIAANFSNLRYIRFHGGGMLIVEWELLFVELLGRIPLLREVWFPQYSLTPTMFSALANIHS